MKTHRFRISNKEKLVDEERRQRQPYEEVLARADVSPEEEWLDLGSGVGYFSIPLTRMVKRVFAVDAEKEMIETMIQRATEEELEHLVPIEAVFPPIPVEDGSVDHVLLVNVLHEVPDRDSLIEEICRVLRPNGRVTLVDFQKREDEFGPPIEERIAVDEAVQLFSRCRLRGEYLSNGYYQLEFTLK